MPLISTVADIIGIMGAIFALFAWIQTQRLKQSYDREIQRQNRRIHIALQHGSTSFELPVSIRRAELTRSEVLGRIGMVPQKEPKTRFNINYLNTKQFQQQMDRILQTSGDESLIIPCTAEEFEQFDLSIG